MSTQQFVRYIRISSLLVFFSKTDSRIYGRKNDGKERWSCQHLGRIGCNYIGFFILYRRSPEMNDEKETVKYIYIYHWKTRGNSDNQRQRDGKAQS